jgi:acetylornithine deacetylase
MRRLGLAVEMWDLDFDKLRSHPAFSMPIERKDGIGVVGSYGRSKGRSLLINGHIDVVSPGDVSKWKYPPWKGPMEEGRVYGRGSADMKGGIVSALFAVKAIIDSGVPLKGRVMLETVIGEEDGGVGALDAALRGYRADAAIVPEPSELSAVPAHAGVMAFRVTVRGKAAHASLRTDGVSAIDKFLLLYEALKRLESERNARIKDPLYASYDIPSPLSIGKIVRECVGPVPKTPSEGSRRGHRRDLDQVKRELERREEGCGRRPLAQGAPAKGRGTATDSTQRRYLPTPIIETVKTAYKDVSGTLPRVEEKLQQRHAPAR